MVAATCFVADFNLRPGFPVVSDLSVKGKPISSYLTQASGGVIDVMFDYSRRGRLPELVSPLGVSPDQMMAGLARVLGPAPDAVASVIGLLMTDACAPAPGQFGLMFDIDGGDTGLGPRQGCAVFLEAIANVSGTDLTDPVSKEFISFIALHEIGHAFNLWHVDDDSIMRPHPGLNDLGSLTFDETQEHFLSLAGGSDTATCVLPGAGRSDYGTRPAGFPSGDAQPFASPGRAKTRPSVHIALSTDSLWPFEPVELDVTLSAPASAARSIVVPNEMDPGYPSFQIWVTRPDGARFRYRPGARYCGRNGTLRIPPKEPYRRDIAIGRQSGGYTFAVPGEHQVQVAFRVAGGDFIMSNAVKCMVNPAQPSSTEWLRARAVMDNAEARHFLQYKRDMPSLQTFASLARYAEDHAALPRTAAAIHFAIGRVLTTSALSMGDARGSQLANRGRRHLEQALQLDCLSTKKAGDASSLLQAESRE